MSWGLGRMQKRQQMLKQVQHDKCRFCSRETMILVTHFMNIQNILQLIDY